MKNLAKCIDCDITISKEMDNNNIRCEKCRKFNEEVKADKEYWRRRKEEIREEAHRSYFGKF